MQPQAYPVDFLALQSVWQHFMETGRITNPPGYNPDPTVIQSWKRCWRRLSPQGKPNPNLLKPQTLDTILKALADLITIAVPYIEDIHQFIEGSHCAILLADSTGCVLVIAGDQTGKDELLALNCNVGTYWAEGQVGTTGIGLALINAMPSQVVGAEHFFKAHHHLVSTAAPIHDIHGRIISCLAIVGPATAATSHTLSLVMAATRAIDNQLQTNVYLEESSRRLTEVNTLLSNISEGVLAWDETGKITHINPLAGKILHLNPTAVLGQPLARSISLPLPIAEAIAHNTELRDVEISFEHTPQPINTLVSLQPIFAGTNQPISYVAMLRPIEQVRRLVHQQVGSQATLRLEDISAESLPMRKILRQAAIAARGTAPVLLRGEGGVGKNRLGRAIHNAGDRASQPFIAINCQAIPHELMITEFLGFDQDAAQPGRPSKFELANGGTLMFDQIESLSLEMQSTLLHLIETKHLMRLQSTRLIPVDVRIIASTDSNLEQLVAERSFIRQLYYAFGVFDFHIPPLRERVEDIPLLAKRFLSRIVSNASQSEWLDSEALSTLSRYPWPGNVRELENVLERAIHHSSSGVISVIDLPDVVRSGRVLKTDTPIPQPIISTAEAEREAIIQAGWACRGRVTEMADRLQIGRTTLWRKLKQLNISPDQFKQ